MIPERGSFQVMAAVVILTFFAAGFVILDLAGVAASRAAVKSVAEGAVLAATQELARIYDTRASEGLDRVLSPGDRMSVIDAALRFAASGTPSLRLEPADVRFVRRGTDGGEFADSLETPDTVEIGVGGAGPASGGVAALLASVVNSGDSFQTGLSVAAGFSPLSTVPEGAVGLPLGISEAWFEGRSRLCGGDSRLTLRIADSSSCLSWNTFTDGESVPASILARIAEDRFLSPAASAGSTRWHFLQGSSDDTAFERLSRLYQSRRDPSGRWEVLLPVFQSEACGNSGGLRQVVGFASATIYRASGPPSPGLEAEVSCRILHLGEGGGRDYGTGSVVIVRPSDRGPDPKDQER